MDKFINIGLPMNVDSVTPVGSATPLEGEVSTKSNSTPKDSNSSQTNTIKEDEDAMSTKRCRSNVWNHFKRQKVEGKMKAECNYCHKKLCGEAKDGTSHLRGHFNRCPLRTTRDIKQCMLGAKIDDKGKSLANWEYNDELIRKELACMIVFHEYPLTMVEHYWFCRFMSVTQPKFKSLSRNTIKSDIFKIFENENSNLKKLLETNDSKVAITTDMWTSTHQKNGFMAITVHFIDEPWTLRSQIIGFLHVPCPHTAEVLSNVLSDSLLQWHLDHKVSALALDNCTTNDSRMRSMHRKLTPNALWLDRKLLHVRCSAHILNLIVKDGLEIIEEFIENVRDSVSFWTTTPKRYETFEETAKLMRISLPKKLVLDCKTRWNSTYNMHNVAIPYKEVFKRLRRESLFDCCPSDEDWEVAQNICDGLKIFHTVTEFFSGTNYPTANEFVPKVCEIRMTLKKWSTSNISYVREMAEKMITKFDKYWNDFNLVLCIATVLDPRYKFKVLEYFLPHVHGEAMTKFEMEKIKEACYELVREYSNSNVSETNFESTMNNESSYLGDGICSYDQFVASSDMSMNNVGIEFDHYLEERIIPRKCEFDLLAWWKNCPKYPTLRAIARDVLAIPMSTVALESAFSTGGRVISDSRSSLHSDTIEALMCTQSWLTAQVKDSDSVQDSLLWTITKDMNVFQIEENMNQTNNAMTINL